MKVLSAENYNIHSLYDPQIIEEKDHYVVTTFHSEKTWENKPEKSFKILRKYLHKNQKNKEVNFGKDDNTRKENDAMEVEENDIGKEEKNQDIEIKKMCVDNSSDIITNKEVSTETLDQKNEEETQTKNLDTATLVEPNLSQLVRVKPIFDAHVSPTHGSKYLKNLKKDVTYDFEDAWPIETSECCRQCTRKIENTPCGIPIKWDAKKKLYYCIGFFCHFPCAREYNRVHGGLQRHVRDSWLLKMATEVFGIENNELTRNSILRIGKPQGMLSIFGGRLSFEQYHQETSDVSLHVLYPPLVRVTEVYEERRRVKKQRLSVMKEFASFTTAQPNVLNEKDIGDARKRLHQIDQSKEGEHLEKGLMPFLRIRNKKEDVVVQRGSSKIEKKTQQKSELTKSAIRSTKTRKSNINKNKSDSQKQRKKNANKSKLPKDDLVHKPPSNALVTDIVEHYNPPEHVISLEPRNDEDDAHHPIPPDTKDFGASSLYLFSQEPSAGTRTTYYPEKDPVILSENKDILTKARITNNKKTKKRRRSQMEDREYSDEDDTNLPPKKKNKH